MKVLMLKDKTGCGWWRMMTPARHMSNAFDITITDESVTWDQLMSHDKIFLQRTHTWQEYEIVSKLKKEGKPILYDIDDDIFNIPPENPASTIITEEHLGAAKAIMGKADAITTTNELLKEKLGFPEKTFVIPNALDLNGWPKKFGSPDGYKRIFWQGSATHGADWDNCVGALDRIMYEHPNVLLLVIGFLPESIQKLSEKKHWRGKIQWMAFQDTDAYFETIKNNIKADVGIAPLNDNPFNRCKSAIKWIEMSQIGMPVIASNVPPYSDAIRHKSTGFLAETEDDWVKYIKWCFNKPSRNIAMVRMARIMIKRHYDIENVVKDWERVILDTI